jgi:hypothetical protein
MPCIHDVIAKIGWEGLTAIFTVVLAAIGALAALYAKGQLDDFRKEAKVKHLIELVQQFEQEPLASQRKELAKERVRDGELVPLDAAAPPPALHKVLNFFDHMAFLLHGEYLDVHGVSVEFHYWVLTVWHDAEKVVDHEQKEDIIYYQYLRDMVKQLTDLKRDRLREKYHAPTEREIIAFYTEEANLPPGSPIPRQKPKSLLSYFSEGLRSAADTLAARNLQKFKNQQKLDQATIKTLHDAGYLEVSAGLSPNSYSLELVPKAITEKGDELLQRLASQL